MSIPLNAKFDINIANEMLSSARNKIKIDSYTPTENRNLIILGGQPAAGKSSIIERLSDNYQKNLVILNGDDFKSLYPNYSALAKTNPDATSKLVQPYSNYVVDNLKKEAMDKGLNTLIEGTMRTSKAPLETVAMFAGNGYIAEAFVVSSNYFSSRIGIEQRYESEVAKQGYGRSVDPKNLLEAYNNIPHTLKELAASGKLSNISVVDRSGNVLAETSKGDDVVKSYVNHRENITPQIYLDVTDRINTVRDMMLTRGASSQELSNLGQIKQDLDQSLNKMYEQTKSNALSQNSNQQTKLTFTNESKISDVLNKFEPIMPEVIKNMRETNTLQHKSLDISLKNLDAKTVAHSLAEKTHGKVSVEFPQEKTKGFERE